MMAGVKFSEREEQYLLSQRIAHLATASFDDAQPDVAAVGFHFDGQRIFLSGYNLQRTRKLHNIHDNPLVAVMVDDIESTDPWKPRGIKIYGRAVSILHGGREAIAVTPLKKWSWGIDRPAFRGLSFELEETGRREGGNREP